MTRAAPHRRTVAAARSLGWSVLIAYLCNGLAGCAALPALGLNLAAQGAIGLVGMGLGSMDAAREQSETDRCVKHAGRGSAINESLETVAPGNEGKVVTFAPAYWRTEFAKDGYPQVERARTPLEGKLTISDKSFFFVPPAGATSVRIPYELMQDVEVPGSATGEPRAMIVKSCVGRFDIVTFPPPAGGQTAAAAATELKARMTAAHAAER